MSITAAEKRRVSARKYQQSDKGRAARRRASLRYRQSDKRIATSLAYEQSDKGRAVRREYQTTEKHRAYQLAYRQSDKGRAYQREYKYDLSLETYEAMLQSQGGLCAICSRPPRKRALSVDHDHATGRVRGLLCAACNTSLGGFQDSPAICFAAAAYIVKSTE